MKIEAAIGGKSSRERFWKNSSQCRGIRLQVKQVMASFCCYDNFDVIVTLVPAKFSSLSNTAVAGFPSLALSDSYSWFSHNITKIQTKKLSLLLSFYFHVVLQHLKTFIQTNFRFKIWKVLCFATLAVWIFRLLLDATFSGRPGKLLCGLKTLLILGDIVI